MDAHVEIAATPFPDARQPLATQPVHRTGLRAGCDLQGRVAVRRRDPNLCAEGRLGERDREAVNQVVALALEPWILGDVEHGDQVAGRTIAGPGTPCPRIVRKLWSATPAGTLCSSAFAARRRP